MKARHSFRLECLDLPQRRQDWIDFALIISASGPVNNKGKSASEHVPNSCFCVIIAIPHEPVASGRVFKSESAFISMKQWMGG